MKYDASYISYYKQDWNRFIREVLGVRLTRKQRQVVWSVQHYPKTAVRSCHAFGKDYVAAAISLAHLYLHYPHSIVIESAPTGKQVEDIMMAEISRMFYNARIELGGKLLSNRIKFEDQPKCFLEGLKPGDKDTEAWTGYHSPNLLLIFTEASGIKIETFEAIEGLLTGNSRLLIVGNPNWCSGEFYKAFKSPYYQKFRFSALDSVNVRAKKQLIPGQIDYGWFKEHVETWCMIIDEREINEELHDFKFEGLWRRPNNLFLIKCLGEFPNEGDDRLIPLSWIEAAQERWKEKVNKPGLDKPGFLEKPGLYDDYGSQAVKEKLGIDDDLRLGVDVAGMGTDMTVFCYRYGNLVVGFKSFVKIDNMETAGKIKAELELDERSQAFIDTIGEGAGVYSRLIEQHMKAVSVKFSGSAEKWYDYTQTRKFANVRAYCWWAIRDALDPQFDVQIALPPVDELTRDLNEPRWMFRSDGAIMLEEKDEIKKRLGRSPDYGDALALTFYPVYYTVELPYEPVMWR